jgi:pimeloyl-ACP methyl ester carboxylesterase
VRLSPIALAVLVAAILCGCGDDEGQNAPASTSTSTEAAREPEVRAPSALEPCGERVPGWRPLAVDHGSDKLDAAVLGEGALGFVLANDSGNQTCDWLSFANDLADRGIQAAVFQYSSVGSPSEVRAVAAALRGHGADQVIALGASAGGRAVVQLAGTDEPGVDAVASLSAEREIGASYPDILPSARRIHLPSLYVGSREDGYTLFGKETIQLHDATPAQINELLLVPGSDHGVDLLAGPDGKRVRPAIVSFASKAVDDG